MVTRSLICHESVSLSLVDGHIDNVNLVCPKFVSLYNADLDILPVCSCRDRWSSDGLVQDSTVR